MRSGRALDRPRVRPRPRRRAVLLLITGLAFPETGAKADPVNPNLDVDAKVTYYTVQGTTWLFRRGSRVVWHDPSQDLALIEIVLPKGPLRPELQLRVATASGNNRHAVEA